MPIDIRLPLLPLAALAALAWLVDPRELVTSGAAAPEAQAVLFRPATPLSVAGVARRTTRRTIRRTAVYASTLPRGCVPVVVNGVTLQQCGGVFYQPEGGQYVVVQVQ